MKSCNCTQKRRERGKRGGLSNEDHLWRLSKKQQPFFSASETNNLPLSLFFFPLMPSVPLVLLVAASLSLAFAHLPPGQANGIGSNWIAGHKTIKCLSYNIRSGSNIDNVYNLTLTGDTILAQQADIVGLQEGSYSISYPSFFFLDENLIPFPSGQYDKETPCGPAKLPCQNHWNECALWQDAGL